MIRALAVACTIAAMTAFAWQPATAEDKAEPKPEKKSTAQQQKMKTCASKWKEEKAAKNVKGQEAYRAFMSACLKG